MPVGALAVTQLVGLSGRVCFPVLHEPIYYVASIREKYIVNICK